MTAAGARSTHHENIDLKWTIDRRRLKMYLYSRVTRVGVECTM